MVAITPAYALTFEQEAETYYTVGPTNGIMSTDCVHAGSNYQSSTGTFQADISLEANDVTTNFNSKICDRAIMLFDISELPDDSNLVDVTNMTITFGIDVAVSNGINGCNLYSIENDPDTVTASAQWTDALNGTLFITNSTTCLSSSELNTIVLPNTAHDDIEDNLDSTWWAISFTYNNETRTPSLQELSIYNTEILVTYDFLVNFTQFNFDRVNPEVLNLYFEETDINSTATQLDVIFPASMNLTCTLDYRFAQTENTYTNITSSPNTWTLLEPDNEVITALCTDVNTNNTARHVISSTGFPFLDQIADFRAGTFGTQGYLGTFDLIVLSGMILTMVGLNRFNEAAGIIISIALIGGLWYFEVVAWQSIMLGIIAVIIMTAIMITRKEG